MDDEPIDPHPVRSAILISIGMAVLMASPFLFLGFSMGFGELFHALTH